VRRKARQAKHGYWFPLVLFGLVILGALPLYRFSIGHYGSSTSSPIDRFGLGGYPGVHPWGAALYWLIAMPLAYAAVAIYYARRARRVGLQLRIWPFVAAGLVLFALVLVSAPGIVQLLHVPHWLVSWRLSSAGGNLLQRGWTPVIVMSLGFFVLARLERSWTMFAIACVFFGVALLANLYNIENAFYRINNWIVPGWAANGAVAGGFLVFTGGLAFIGLHFRGRSAAE
jgi:hypothetical protein